jgi:hypothetical protein
MEKGLPGNTVGEGSEMVRLGSDEPGNAETLLST